MPPSLVVTKSSGLTLQPHVHFCAFSLCPDSHVPKGLRGVCSCANPHLNKETCPCHPRAQLLQHVGEKNRRVSYFSGRFGASPAGYPGSPKEYQLIWMPFSSGLASQCSLPGGEYVSSLSAVAQPVVSLLDTGPKHAAFQVGPAQPPPGQPRALETMAGTAPARAAPQPPCGQAPSPAVRALPAPERRRVLGRCRGFCHLSALLSLFPVPPLSAPLAGLHSPFLSDLKCCLIGEADPNAPHGFGIPR